MSEEKAEVEGEVQDKTLPCKIIFVRNTSRNKWWLTQMGNTLDECRDEVVRIDKELLEEYTNKTSGKEKDRY